MHLLTKKAEIRFFGTLDADRVQHIVGVPFKRFNPLELLKEITRNAIPKIISL